MPARALPNLGLQAFFDLGEDGWGDEMSLNMLWLSVLVQGIVDSKVAAEPGAPADGDIHILDETHATNANEIAVRDDGAWLYKAPVEGWSLYNLATGTRFEFDGTEWVEEGGSAGITIETEAGTAYTFASADAGKHKRFTAATAITATVPLNASDPVPVGTRIRITAAGAGQITLTPESGTVNLRSRDAALKSAGQYAVLEIEKVGTDEWDVLGDVTA